MSLYELTPGSVPDWDSILPLELAKAQTGVDSSDDTFDTIIAQHRDAALDLVASFTMKALAPGEYTWRGRFPDDRGTLRLGIGPVTAVTAITYLDSGGNTQTMDVAGVIIGPQDRLTLKPGISWPSAADMDGAVTITFTAGYAANAVPPALKQAALFMVGHMFANRESVVIGQSAVELPLAFTRLCHAYRTPVV